MATVNCYVVDIGAPCLLVVSASRHLKEGAGVWRSTAWKSRDRIKINANSNQKRELLFFLFSHQPQRRIYHPRNLGSSALCRINMAPTSDDAPKTLGADWRTDDESIVVAETNAERLESASRSSSPDTVIFDPEFATAPSSLRRQSGHRASGLFSLPPPPTLGSQPDNTPYKFPTRAAPRKLPELAPEAARRYALGQPLPGLPLEFPVIDTYREPQPHRTPDRQPPPTPRFACAPFDKHPPPPPSPQCTTPKLKLLRGSPERSPSRTQNPESPRFRIRGNYHPALNNMSYQNYLDTPQTGSGPGPRQAPSPSQGMPHANGANGGAAMPGMMGGLPTPAGHQSDLNVIYNMVETLHNELAETRARSERIVAAAGIIRARALEQNLTAEQIAAGVAAELNEGTKNLEEENSRLRHALDHATHEEAAYKALCEEFAVTMGNALEMGHAYKLKTTLDMCAWHRSYRDQLAAERAENLELRCRISDMQASAARGMEQMRLFRRGWDRSNLVMELRTEIVSLRQQARGWKRVALSELASDDSEFSDDDDVIDPEEKKRLARVEEEKRGKEEGEARRVEEEEGAGEALVKALEGSHLAETGGGEITI